PGSYAELSDEIRTDLGAIDYLVGAVGSGGSLCGSARAIRSWSPNVKVIAVDAVGSILFGQPDRPGRLQSGLGNSISPKNLDLAQVDEVHWLNDEEAFSATLELARREKIFAGNSSGSVYAVASWLSRRISASERIVAIFPDRGDRYFNSIFNDQYREKHNLAFRMPQEPTLVHKTDVVHSWSYASLSGRESHAETVAIP
ncbi:pyridoxal-phosphate dependent enzyme, partial [Gorillibacterium massiliense]|uniref:pyridoxal-phosphate dependent enzyme n=1 Tax=Gorillibacterium massiliense TaxID=1280390 RepID=UPI0005954489